MPQLKNALLAFGKLIGVMDDSGSVQFLWFLDPLNNSFNGFPQNRAHLLELVQYLQASGDGNPPDSADFDAAAHLIWVPITISGNVSAGLIWNNDASPLDLGIGAKLKIGQQLDLGVLARLIQMKVAAQFPNQITPEFGKFRVTGSLPVPDFIDSAAINLSIDATAAPHVALGLDVARKPNSAPQDARHFNVPNPNLAWDCARLAVFVLRAWVHSQALQSQSFAAMAGVDFGSSAQGPDNFFTRVDNHLWPALGADAQANGPIQPFPIVGDQPGAAPNFQPWQNSVLSFSNNGQGAITFLWHLRALITGNESSSLFNGSFFFPLVGGGGPAGTPLPPPLDQFATLGSYENTPHTNSVFIGLTTEPNGTTHNLVVDLFNNNGARERIVLASMNGTCVRPVLPNVGDAAWDQLKNFAAGFNGLTAGATDIEVVVGNDTITMTLFKETVSNAGPFDGDYELRLTLAAGGQVSYRFKTPLLEMALPPSPQMPDVDKATLFIGILSWILGTLGLDQQSAEGKLIQNLLTVVQKALASNNPPDVTPLMTSVVELLGQNQVIDFGGSPLKLAFSQGAIEPSVAFGPFKPGDLGDLPVHIGKVEAGAGIDISNGAVKDAKLAFYDLRFGKGAGADATGLVGSLLPDTRQVPGFSVAISVTNQSPFFSITGGGKIPIQETIGPLELAGMLVDLKQQSLLVGLDLSFKLGPINVSAYELGVEFPYSAQPPTPFLHGLSLSLDMSAVKLAGMFAKTNIGDYVGGAVVKVVDMFQLSAIGGYTQLPGDKPSLFIFASLVAPLGGPPWFFITGIAGGFGYNRTLPPPGLLTKHPFIQVMRGDLPISGDSSTALTQLGTYFTPVLGQYWVAAGIQFIAFGFINGKLVVSIAFGNKFSIQVLGLAAFGIQNIAYFELGIEASGDDEVFKLKAGLSKNSYIIHPDIMSLSGDFGLGVWHGGEHAGDFVLSVGGYHPYFKKPEHYDDLARVAVHCVVYGFIRMSVECFFACTPQALMAGASVSLAAEFAGIGCGLDVYIDVFMRWDPFFILARMGVALWFEFFGRHEISVDLQIWTPKFGGTATIDLALVSFDVDFGTPLAAPPPPLLYQFLTKQIGVPSTADYKKAVAPAFNTDSQAGLFRVDFTEGRTTKPQDKSSRQEGVTTPVPVAAEFGFTVTTRLPLNYAMAWDPGLPVIVGKINVPLCELFDLSANFNVTTTNLAFGPKVVEYMKDLFPAANFGSALPSAQSGSRQAVGKIDTSKPSLPLWDGFRLRCEASIAAAPAAITAKPFEDSVGPDEEYPLPLAVAGGAPSPVLVTKSTIKFNTKAQFTVVAAGTVKLSSRQMADILVQKWKPLPLRITWWSARLQRFPIDVRLRGLTVAAPPADAPVIGVPTSPARRSELHAVSFRAAAPKAPVDLRRRRLDKLTRAVNLQTKLLTPPESTATTYKGSISVAEGIVTLLDFEGDTIQKQTLAISGSQTVRVVYLGGGEDFIAADWVVGSGLLTAPARTRRIALIGEGMYPPVAGVAARLSSSGAAMAIAPVTEPPAPVVTRSTPPVVAKPTTPTTTPILTRPTTPTTPAVVWTARENIGVEHDTTVTALGRRAFAGHGCVVECRSRTHFSATPLDAVPGFELLRSATTFQVAFPSVGANGALVLRVAPLVADAGVALQEVRWFAVDALLSGLTTAVGPDSTAFVMSVNSSGPWLLEIDLGRKWRLVQVVACPQTARDMVNLMKADIERDLIDDRLQRSRESAASSATLEVA
jgi:hypothetical protein